MLPLLLAVFCPSRHRYSGQLNDRPGRKMTVKTRLRKILVKRLLWLAVDRTEIFYFCYGDEERAKRIQRMLQETGVLKTTIRKVDMHSRNYEIQIKVGQIPTAGPI